MISRLLIALALTASLAAATRAAEIPLDERRSGLDFAGNDSRQMQADDTSNPAFLWVREGEALWAKTDGVKQSCASCHNDAATTMKGVSARYPAYSEAKQRPVDLAGQVNICRETRQDAKPFAHESREMLALTAYIGLQSRGMPTAPPDDARLEPFRRNGEQLFNARVGQLNFSCANCHNDNWGKRLASAPIPQGHANGYPLYRLEWQSLGSLQRRFRNCMSGVRATAFAYGAPEWVDLELYLAWRARGMPVETPAVRP
ncbi:SoxAX cytochrome complex subunit A precursor [Variibacter gotjawalensis]|uniref:SoxAX cytochrome complex subunit A n=1 Tax=Variibacter gotjawalensis TaxID=1333996 RepID=A0A0S3PYL6_9BRAD|nr:sulfur oxidation c-type cytochrome SoxA [Variibacter gotjawalensis]NIK46832.1 sulfur-oxidizing protein SoxA [Variibacter gotjawalensis]RZS48736.1 sulfur-oxidizing protein SoxA [Variibacter gotjawalensis]BAT60995.1 SoxAX cytochrome complex subunit A precursor [Variibacter gotjawalensis]